MLVALRPAVLFWAPIPRLSNPRPHRRMFRACRRRPAPPAPGTTGAAPLAVLAPAARASVCSAPISTIRSPAHPRVIEIPNTAGEARLSEIEPAAFEHLAPSTAFTGRLPPGE